MKKQHLIYLAVIAVVLFLAWHFQKKAQGTVAPGQ